MGEELVRQLYEASYRRLVGQLYAVCGDMSEAEDVVQEAFARAVQHGRRFARLDNPEAWLRTVALNLARTRWRRRALGERLHTERARAATSRRHPPDLSDDRLALVAALRRLPSAQREVIALHYLADLPLHEVGRSRLPRRRAGRLQDGRRARPPASAPRPHRRRLGVCAPDCGGRGGNDAGRCPEAGRGASARERAGRALGAARPDVPADP